MIPNATMDVETLESNFTGERIDMTLDEDSLSHIMSVLTDLYSDTIGASVREYSTNARDAHLESGKGNVPIEITAPTAFNPMFKVRDFGEGLTLEDLRNVYSKYGASTKRESVFSNGMIGVGSKAALTYTSSFTVMSVAKGKKHIVSISRDEDGGGHFDIVDVSDTTEPTGVEVQIPVSRSDVSSFNDRIRNFFKWWEPGTAKIDGVPNKGLDLDEYTPVDDDGKIYFGNRYDNIIIMGGVAYPSPFESPFQMGKGYVYFAEMGEVVFSPSRESLRTNKRNREVHERVVSEIKAKVSAKAMAMVADAPNIIEAHRTAERANRDMIYPVLGSRHTPAYVYKGKPMADTLKDSVRAWIARNGDNAVLYSTTIVDTGLRSYVMRRDGHHSASSVADVAVDARIIATGVPEEVIDDNRRRSVFMRGMRELGYTGNRALVFDSLNGFDKAIDNGVPVVKWEDIRNASKEALKRNRGAGVKRKEAKKNSNEAHVINGVSGQGTMDTTLQDIDPKGRNVVFLPRGAVRTSGGVISGYDTYSRCNTFNSIMQKFPAYTFVAVTKGQEDSFTKRFPKATALKDLIDNMSRQMFVDAVVKEFGGPIDKAEIYQFVTGRYYRFDDTGAIDTLRRIHSSGDCKSDYVDAFVEAQDRAQDIYKAYVKVNSEWTTFVDEDVTVEYLTENFAVDKVETVHDRTRKALSRYPLIGEIQNRRGIGSKVIKHACLYIHTVDANADQ